MRKINYFLDNEGQVVKEKKSLYLKLKEKLGNFLCYLILLIFARRIDKMWNELQQKKRYKKIIKKGVFWDSEYLIEKDND